MTARVGIVLGTRPEVIKLGPLVRALQQHPATVPVVISTGQHRDLLDRLLAGFGVTVDVELDLMVAQQRLADLAGRAVQQIGAAIERLALDLLVVQGDTTTTMAGALAGFYGGVPVVHLEAGLRTDDRYAPYPEEVNRRMVTQLADLHLAPTPQAAARLHGEGVDPAAVVMTGNTVVDALLETVRRRAPFTGPDAERLTAVEAHPGRVLLVTAHRRESWGVGIGNIARAVAATVDRCPDLVAVFPLHPNPQVRDVVLPVVADRLRVVTTDPLDYPDFVRLLARADLVLTDSGGIQEEACSLGKPTLVTRDATERPEGLDAGGLRLVGTDAAVIGSELLRLLRDPSAYDALVCRSLPFGAGDAAARSVAAIVSFLDARPRSRPSSTSVPGVPA